MRKNDLIITIEDEKIYKGREVKSIINSVTADYIKPTDLKYGDIVLYNVGRKRRPITIIKVIDNLVLGIPLTTTEDVLALGEYNSRFLGRGSFTKQVVTVPFEYAISNFITILDDIDSLKSAHQQIKELYNNWI